MPQDHKRLNTSTPRKDTKKYKKFSQLDESFIEKTESDSEDVTSQIKTILGTTKIDCNSMEMAGTGNLEETISSLELHVKDAFAKLSEKIEDIADIKNELKNCLKAQRLEQKYDLDKLEQYTRRENVRISGFIEEGENLADKVIKLANDISVEITTSDISTVHKLGRVKPGSTRPVICRFVARHKRDLMIYNRKKLKDIPEYSGKVYINDDLTPLRSKMMGYAKSLPNVKRVNSNNGKIYCNTDDNKLVILESPDDMYHLGLDNLDYPRLGLDKPGATLARALVK